MDAAPSLSPAELAQLYRVTPKTLRRWIEAVPELRKTVPKGRKMYVPTTVKRIFEAFGEPIPARR
jgi:hypothetical protein